MAAPLISVALCTYNGATFLQEQLDSIARQTRLPDEVVVRDDRSRDDTVGIVERWGRGTPFPVRTEVNAENLGSTDNFATAVAACAGDLVVLCDQDDVWLPGKLERLGRFFAENRETEAVFTDGWLVDQSLQKIQLLSQKVPFRPAAVLRDLAAGRIVSTLARRSLATGATMALRSSLRETVLPVPVNLPRDLIHDGWIALVAALRGTLGFLAEPTILYRQHAGQQVGLSPAHDPGRPRWLSADARARIVADTADADARLVRILRARFPDLTARLGPFEERARHHAARCHLPAALARRVFPVLGELLGGRYHRYARGFRTALGDLRT